MKDMNGITIDLPKEKNFFTEFVFTISILVRNFVPQNVSKLINKKPSYIPFMNISNSFKVFFGK